jgi:hypothetical protein
MYEGNISSSGNESAPRASAVDQLCGSGWSMVSIGTAVWNSYSKSRTVPPRRRPACRRGSSDRVVPRLPPRAPAHARARRARKWRVARAWRARSKLGYDLAKGRNALDRSKFHSRKPEASPEGATVQYVCTIPDVINFRCQKYEINVYAHSI